MAIERKGSLEKALNRLLVSDKQHVKVGVLDNSKYPDGTSVASVAFWNEYGTKTTPSRPFIRTAVKDNKAVWSKMTIQGIRAGYDMEKVFGLVGTQMQQDLQMNIMTWTTPPNAPYTVKMKGFQAPLRNTMLLHDSIKYEVADGSATDS